MSEPKLADKEVAECCVHLCPLPASMYIAWYREQCEAAARADEHDAEIAEAACWRVSATHTGGVWAVDREEIARNTAEPVDEKDGP